MIGNSERILFHDRHSKSRFVNDQKRIQYVKNPKSDTRMFCEYIRVMTNNDKLRRVTTRFDIVLSYSNIDFMSNAFTLQNLLMIIRSFHLL